MFYVNPSILFTIRDYPSCRRDSRPPQSVDQHQHHVQQARWDSGRADSGRDNRNGHGFAPAPAPLFLRGRAMSENDLRFDSSLRWSPSVSAATSQTLSEVEEGASHIMRGDSASSGRQNRKKMPPPPRPPPPKWEQFHRRRASHHGLLSSFSAAAPHPGNTAEGHYSAHSSSYIPPPDTSRQRSFSSPPERQEVAESCSRCSCSQTQVQDCTTPHAPPSQSPAQFQERTYAVASPSPVFSRKAFRPVAPSPVERESDLRTETVTSLPSPPPPQTGTNPSR